jgi:maltooligosyltrehalose trehalohydrolase
MVEAASRRMPIGAEIGVDGVHFRVWAPDRRRVDVVGPAFGARPMQREADGYFSAHVPKLGAGALYRFRLDGDIERPDPASRFQPEGPHGPSMVVDPHTYRWSDGAWKGLPVEGQVLYEMHVGTFTQEGTFAAAAVELPRLAEIGVTTIELMPVACFDGAFGWGYDGVDLFAPYQHYGTPDDLRRFVDQAHRVGMSVILDVVYNHLGPSGNYLRDYAKGYFSTRYENEWGDPLNFDGPDARPVREFFIANAAYWIREFHMDGLRLDATQQIFDASTPSILAEITRAVREAAGDRRTYVVAENEPQDARLLGAEDEGGYGMDAAWNDDFHHSAHVVLTGRAEAYYSDYRGTPQELVSALRHGWLYQGQFYTWQDKTRGTPSRGLEPCRFVTFLENHDQVANSATGARMHDLAAAGTVRALTALLLLGPGTPMLFQGQEYGSTRPFLYFADHEPSLAAAVAEGRAAFLKQFPGLSDEGARGRLTDPADPETFRRSRLDPGERALPRHRAVLALHRDLLALRRSEAAFRHQCKADVEGAVLSPDAFLLRFLGQDAAHEDRLVLVNLGRDLDLDPSPEPMLAPPLGMRWEAIWNSEDARYGGIGTGPVVTRRGFCIAGRSAVVLRPVTLDVEAR